MRIGVDFDNTIVNYEGIFHRAALESDLIPATIPKSKKAVKDYLQSIGKADTWTELQGLVYGKRMLEAEPFSGVLDFFGQAQKQGHKLYIISHKTKLPFKGPQYDLHASARNWVHEKGFFADPISLPEKSVFFELTLSEKIQRIQTCQCDVFIDDLPELLLEPAFPSETAKILFDPFSENTGSFESEGIRRQSSWNELLNALKEGFL